MSNLIYIADDDTMILALVKQVLEQEGFNVKAFDTGDALYEAFTAAPSDLVVIDVVMPGSFGGEIAQKIRETSTVPIIMLTSQDAVEDYVTGMEQGADVYLTKPFKQPILLVHVKTLLQRALLDASPKRRSKSISYQDITLYPEDLQALCKGEEIHLTKTEFDLLAYLMENEKASVSRDELLKKIWNYGELVETRVTDDVVKRLRRKLDKAESNVIVETVWGHGFKIGTRKS